MINMTKKLFSLAVGLVFLANVACAEPLNKVVAVVNKGVITQLDLDSALTQAKAQARMRGLDVPDDAIIRKQVLNQLIITKIALELAKMNGITVQKIEVDDAIAKIATRNHMTLKALDQAIQAQGISLDAYRKTIKDHLLTQKLEQSAVASSIRITPEEVSNFLKTAKLEQGSKALYQVDHILVALPNNPDSQSIKATQQKAQEVVKQLQAGGSFAKLAMKYSDASDALKGGVLSPRTLADMPEVFASHLPQMKPGQVLGPIQTESGFQILKLVSVKKPGNQEHEITQYHVKWIMLKTSPILSSSQANTLLLSLHNAIENGASFATVAKANSQDIDSANNGGDAGWLDLSALSPRLAQAIAQAKLNVLSKPIKDGDKWYMLEVLAKRSQDDTKAYRQQQAERILFQRKAQKAVMAWQAKIRAESYVKVLK